MSHKSFHAPPIGTRSVPPTSTSYTARNTWGLAPSPFTNIALLGLNTGFG